MRNRVEKIEKNCEFLDKRAYFTIDKNYEVKRKKMNMSIVVAAFLNNEEFEVTLEKEIDKKERQKRKKIERFSNLDLDKIRENLIKLVIKGECEFAKRYAKELALRNKELFIKTIFELSLMDNIEFRKPLLALAFERVIDSIGWNDSIGDLVISYFSKQRYDLYEYENARNVEKIDIMRTDKIEIESYRVVLNRFEYKNKGKYIDILNKSVKKDMENTELDRKILNEIVE